MIFKSGDKINRKDEFGQNALECALIELHHYKSRKVCEKVAPTMLFAGGEKIHRKLEMCRSIGFMDFIFLKRYELLQFLPLTGCDFSLKHLCRKAIRKHLLQVDKHRNLFTRVTQLGLPLYLPEYLVYDMSLEKEYKFDKEEDDDSFNSDDIGGHNDTFDSFSDSEEDDDDDKSTTTDDNIDDSDDEN